MHDVTIDKNTVLFDVDGTLFNSEKIHALATFEVLATIGIQSDSKELYREHLGLTDYDIYRNLKEIYPLFNLTLSGFVAQKDEEFIKITQSMDESEFTTLMAPGIDQLLSKLVKKGVKVAAVSASEKESIHFLLKRSNLLKYFKVVVTQGDTFMGKPNPSPYLKAMRILKSKSSDTIIFEDSETGALAGKLSGSHVVRAVTFLPSKGESLLTTKEDLVDGFLTVSIK